MITRCNEGEAVDFDWGQIVWMISDAQQNSSVMTFGTVTIKGGMANTRHRHPNCDEILHVISGQIEHSLGDERHVMNPGDTISIPKGVVHNAKSTGFEDAKMVICFSSADRQTEGE